MEVIGAQIRAARAFLRWTLHDLADRAGVNESTVRAIENSDAAKPDSGVPGTKAWREESRARSMEKVVATLRANGITFLDKTVGGYGVRCNHWSEQ